MTIIIRLSVKIFKNCIIPPISGLLLFLQKPDRRELFESIIYEGTFKCPKEVGQSVG